MALHHDSSWDASSAHPTHPPPLQTSLPCAHPHTPPTPTPLPSSALQNPFYEVWDPAHATKPTLVFQLSAAFTKNTKYFYYPVNFVLPTGRCKSREGCYHTPRSAPLQRPFL